MLIVATAGHIDHGKTSLVHALTGVDTDRLPEERARGISIDLGFAYWQAAPDTLVAFVDVPGHHRFIRNMLAGVAAIDFALLVVAIDDGPMPQTIEHVQILDFLGVSQGVVVLTKADAGDPQRIAEVGASVAALLRGTALAGFPMLAVSARSGAGLPELKALLAASAQTHESAQAATGAAARRARFTIDRVFSVRGAGTVVTGTVVDGCIACEDRLTVSASGAALRVRGIQVHGQAVNRVASGERAAINLAGTPPPELARGQWLTDPATAATGAFIEVSLALLPGDAPLRHDSPARLYLGAAERACRVLLRGQRQIEPGERAAARLHLEQPVVAVNGDRFVLRDGPGTRTLGGGRVIDPCPGPRRKVPDADEQAALSAGEPTAALGAMLRARGPAGVSLARFERIFNLDDAARQSAVEACQAVVLGKAEPAVFASSLIEQLTAAAAAVLQNDERTAIRLDELRDQLAPAMPAEAFEALLRTQAERLNISLAGSSVSLRERRDSVRSADQAAWERIRPLLVRSALNPAELADLAREASVGVGRIGAILHARSLSHEVFALRPDKYLLRELVAELAAAAAETAAMCQDGRFTAAQYRDRIGTGRTLAIHVLEMLDVIGVTRRVGDQRTVVRDPQQLLGPASPYRAAPSATPLPTKPSRPPVHTRPQERSR